MSPEQRTVVFVLAAALLLGSVYAYLRDNVFAWSGAAELAETEVTAEITVHVTGAVVSPGVYHLPRGSRIQDALAAAGGLTESAEENALNLASFLTDGQRVNAPESEPESAEDDEMYATQRLVNVNTANQPLLETLPGVGPQTAKRILEYRAQNGKFASVEDLTKVSGIGAKTLERLRPYITVR